MNPKGASKGGRAYVVFTTTESLPARSVTLFAVVSEKNMVTANQNYSD